MLPLKTRIQNKLSLADQIWRICLISCLLCGFAQAADPAAVILKHRWQMQPNLRVEWGEQRGEAPALLDFARLKSDHLPTQRQEAARAGFLADRLSPEQKIQALEVIEARLPPNSIPSSEPLEQLAFIGAALRLSDGTIAEQLWPHVQTQPILRSGVEAALIENQSGVAEKYWLEVLASETTLLNDKLSAVSGLASCDLEAVLPTLKSKLSPTEPKPLQLALAKSIGKLAASGMLESATIWKDRDGNFGQLIAALLLQRHGSEAADLMSQFVINGPPVVQRLALNWLARNDVDSATKQLSKLCDSRDPNLCLEVIATIKWIDEPGPLNQTASLLGHNNPDVRRSFRACLQEKAKSTALQSTVEDIVRTGLKSEKSTMLEQAILLATFLGQRSETGQLIALLEHPDPVVFIRAGWALQLLASEPDDLRTILTFAEQQTELLENRTPEKPFSDEATLQLAYLFQALGQNKVKAADLMFRRFIPKQDQKMQPITRTAAIWALGQIWADSRDSRLEDALAARVMDQNPMNPEESIVMYASAIALGNIGNPSVRERVARAGSTAPDTVVPACKWCVEQLSK